MEGRNAQKGIMKELQSNSNRQEWEPKRGSIMELREMKTRVASGDIMKVSSFVLFSFWANTVNTVTATLTCAFFFFPFQFLE